ncbi:GGDEF domain-containing protein [Paenibacillus faecis]|uniref:GGDEF domain-containing protein n=1 Tax=Paenibacillus faecis TaxID=862114 RepID=A0A5D0CQH0_9BACL|nr:GGDEF domain-containing protein [Paenibacillus faecis]TYA11544.1 GGDEF domain-containing protein [Paenibacillus faecis]
MHSDFKVGSQITDIPSNRNQRRLAVLLALFISALSVAALPFGTKILPSFEPFLPILISWFIFGDLLTAFILFSQFRASGVPSLLVISCTYLYIGIITALHILTFPGVFSEEGMLGANNQSAGWLWIFWHGGFPAGILIYLYVGIRYPQPLESKKDISFYTAIGLFLTFLSAFLSFEFATDGADHMPRIIDVGSYRSILDLGIGPVLGGLNLLVMALVLLRFRTRSVLHLWIAIALLALFLDTLLTVFAGTRYSLGWYLARVNSVISATVVLCSAVSEVNRLFIRLSDQHKQLLESGRKLEKANEELLRLSSLDGLTEIPNRRRLDEIISWELVFPEERQTPLSLLILDVDCFKAYNDHYGHLGGDHVLKKIARTISAEVKPYFGFAARYGGEEFAVLLSGLDVQGTFAVAERIRTAVERLEIMHAGSASGGKVTISIGGHCLAPFQGVDQDELIYLADQCLYEAKDAGRNCCIIKGWSRESGGMRSVGS